MQLRDRQHVVSVQPVVDLLQVLQLGKEVEPNKICHLGAVPAPLGDVEVHLPLLDPGGAIVGEDGVPGVVEEGAVVLADGDVLRGPVDRPVQELRRDAGIVVDDVADYEGEALLVGESIEPG